MQDLGKVHRKTTANPETPRHFDAVAGTRVTWCALIVALDVLLRLSPFASMEMAMLSTAMRDI